MSPSKAPLQGQADGPEESAELQRSPVLGCIADDITGASDLADALVRAGLSTVQVFGVPRSDDVPPLESEAIVVALKTRTCPPEEAVRQSVDTAHWLDEQHVRHTYFKYCSTFDSTPAGNIGPVADALWKIHRPAMPVVHCPAYPVNQRTLYQGYLFVGSTLLSESGMRDHPLTPMRDANLVRVLAEQTPAEVGLLPLERIRSGRDAILVHLQELVAGGVRHVLADAIDGTDLVATAGAVRDHRVAAGGAGFGAAWAAALLPPSAGMSATKPAAPIGYAAGLVGSASTATSGQVAAFQARWPVLWLDAATLAAGPDGIAAALDWARQRLPQGPVMIAADTSPEAIQQTRARFGANEAAEVVESTLARLAVGLVELNVNRLVVAGGETSGAVAAALGLTHVQVGPQICPGVPWTISTDPALAVAFKSGNFGTPDFFADAFASFETDQWRQP